MHEPRLKQRVQACSSSSGFGCIGLSDLGRTANSPPGGEEGREKVPPRLPCLKFAYVTATNAIASKRILKMRCPLPRSLLSHDGDERLEHEASKCNCGSGKRNHVGSVTTAAHCEISGRRAKKIALARSLSRPRLGRIHELDRKSEEKKNFRWRKRPGE